MKLVLLRHGQSTWNLENRFTGWTDVPLTEKGIEEAKEAGRKLERNFVTIDLAYTSVLKRAEDTLKYTLEELGEEIPVKRSWRLNERHYGALQGLNKDETKLKYGAEQVQLWRRSVFETPPALTKDDPRYPGKDLKYKDIPEEEIPLTENLQDTLERVKIYLSEEIFPELLKGKNILVVAHGNSLRALVKHIEHLTNEEIVQFEMQTGIPYVYELDDQLNIYNKYTL